MYNTATEQIADKRDDIKSFRLATVSALFDDNCPKITFWGEETPSEKKYKIIDDTSYSVGDTVLVGIVNDGYIIIGAVGFNPTGGAVVYLTEEQANLLFAAKNHTHTDYAAKIHSHTNYALTIHTHTEYAKETHKHNMLHSNPASTVSTGLEYDGWSFRVNYSGANPTLGTSNYKWGQIYSTNSVISTSDRNKKHDIKPLDKRYETFIKELKPMRFKLNGGTSNRYHTGYISQDVRKAMKKANLSDKEFAGFIRSPRMSEKGKRLKGYDYGLRYEEFISLNTMMIQKLFNMVESQNERIEELERRFTDGQNL